jgi:hypothetical protein
MVTNKIKGKAEQMRLSEQSLIKLVHVFKKSNRNFIFIFSLTRLANSLKTICASIESTDPFTL